MLLNSDPFYTDYTVYSFDLSSGQPIQNATRNVFPANYDKALLSNQNVTNILNIRQTDSCTDNRYSH